MEKVTKVVAITVTVWSALYISRFTEYAGLMLAPAQNQAIFLGLVMALAFLSCPAKKGMKGVKWYDWIFVFMGVVPNAYVLLFYDTWQLHGGTEPKSYEIVFSIALAIVLLEGLRRVLGLVLSILLLCFMLHPIFSNHLPGIFFGRGYSVSRVGAVIFFPPEGIYSMPLNIAATIVIGFLIFGALLLVSAAGQTLTDLALSAVGRVRGRGRKSCLHRKWHVRNAVRKSFCQCCRHRHIHHTVNETDRLLSRLCGWGRSSSSKRRGVDAACNGCRCLRDGRHA